MTASYYKHDHTRVHLNNVSGRENRIRFEKLGIYIKNILHDQVPGSFGFDAVRRKYLKARFPSLQFHVTATGKLSSVSFENHGHIKRFFAQHDLEY